MIKAFVFGKFYPFHKGHEAMIHFALTKCDFLTVLVCCSDKENIPCAVRCGWIEKTFEKEKNIEIRPFNYLESKLPNTSASSEIVSEIWAGIFKKQFPDYTLLITSEEYGNYVATFMNIRHIPFDISKKKFPVSASIVRNDIFTNWIFLPESVKPYFSIKIVLLGTESTGKTTLTERLAKHFNCSVVLEAGRDIIDNSNNFCFEDLYLVAKEHSKRINEATIQESPVVIIDTDIHITKSYSEFIFNRKLDISDDIYNSNTAMLYLYLNNDVDYIQDGTRLHKTERDLLDVSHRKILNEHNIAIIEIKGSWQERFENAVEHIEKLITANSQQNK